MPSALKTRGYADEGMTQVGRGARDPSMEVSIKRVQIGSCPSSSSMT